MPGDDRKRYAYDAGFMLNVVPDAIEQKAARKFNVRKAN